MMKKKRNYFEGWYYREQSKDLTIAFIPALHYDEEGRMTGSLQVVLPQKSWFIAYPHPVNMNLKDSLFVVLGKNVFTEACIHLDIDEPGLSVKGDIYFDRDYGTKFHVMGPLGLPILSGLASRFLPCGHHIWAMEQELSGELEIRACGGGVSGSRVVDSGEREKSKRHGADLRMHEKGKPHGADAGARFSTSLRAGTVVSFDGGRGYLECDYGKTFPASYFWSQCNWFVDKSLRISCAGVVLSSKGSAATGRVPFLSGDESTVPGGNGRRLTGCFACIDQKGYRLKLATYRGAKVEAFSPESFRIRQGKYIFEGWKMEGKPVTLQAPLGDAMSETTEEYLECTVRYRLTHGGDVLFDEISQRAAYEFR